jgi:citrate lyase subunit alpha/citrate CoA-transferase
MSKLVSSLTEAIQKCGLKDHMTISFHHHLRNGDYVLNKVLDAISELGIKDLTVNASSIFDIHEPILKHIKSGVVTGLEVDYMGQTVGEAISHGALAKPVVFRTHGGRPAAIESGRTPIDVAFVAASQSDEMGNCTGKYGKSACGALGYAMSDARCAAKTVVVTDDLEPYPLQGFSIPETDVDYVVAIDAIGNPAGIVSGTTKITRDPVGLKMADMAIQVIQASGLLKDGFSFQTGAGGASLAAAVFLKDLMLEKKIKGSFVMGGITGYLVDLLESGCFRNIMDVQCFDMKAVESLAHDPRHMEVSASHYASPTAKSSIADQLDVVILGATQVDTNFNVNVHTNSRGIIMGGSGGHTDIAAGAKLSMIVAPLSRARMSLVVDRVQTISTPGSTVDVVLTQRGIAVNPRREDLQVQLKKAGLPVVSIETLKKTAEEINGIPEPLALGSRIVAEVEGRDGKLLDHIYEVL